MPNLKDLFLKHVGQTGPTPFMIEIDYAYGVHLYDRRGKHYIDLDSGIAVSALGHCHPQVVAAINKQTKKYLHTTVYGEHIQMPQVQYAKTLTDLLPKKLNSVYFVNSGSEAIEGAIKLAKRYTGRYEVIAFKNAYHGSTSGAESLRSDMEFTMSYQPLVPGIRHLEFNSLSDLGQISTSAACVIVEPVRGEAGVQLPRSGYLKALKKRCAENGVLLIFDEIQTGFGRTGKLFAFEHFEVIPDVLVLAKAMGGGLPLGAFISDQAILGCLSTNPSQGHISTFGGNPLSCTAALATLKVLIDQKLVGEVEDKAQYLKSKLKHTLIKEIRSLGLMMAIVLKPGVLHDAIEAMVSEGLLINWFLFDDTSFRISPPLIISKKELSEAAEKLLLALDKISS